MGNHRTRLDKLETALQQSYSNPDATIRVWLADQPPQVIQALYQALVRIPVSVFAPLSDDDLDDILTDDRG